MLPAQAGSGNPGFKGFSGLPPEVFMSEVQGWEWQRKRVVERPVMENRGSG